MASELFTALARRYAVSDWAAAKEQGRKEGCAEAADLITELTEALRDCADDLEAEIEARRGSVLERSTERDLASVRKARAALAKTEDL